MGDAGGQLFDSLRSIGWMLKPIWGFVSDQFPLFGYKRKSWYVLMALLGATFWFLTAILSFSGIKIPMVYLIVFNLAFGTYAFVDVVTDAIMVTEGQRLKRVGSLVNFQWIALSFANAIALFLGGWLQDNINCGAIDTWVVFFLAGLPPLVTAFIGVTCLDEEKTEKKPRPHRARQPHLTRRTLKWFAEAPGKLNQFRKQNRLLWLLILFIFFWKFTPAVGYIERSYLLDERAFTRYVAEEVRDDNICVVTFSPRFAIATEDASDEAKGRMPGPDVLLDAFVLAAELGMDASGTCVAHEGGKLVPEHPMEG